MDLGYVLETGAAGAARLALLEKVYGPDCHGILSAAGVAAGMRIADVGCGTGSTSAWFARRVGEGGSAPPSTSTASRWPSLGGG